MFKVHNIFLGKQEVKIQVKLFWFCGSIPTFRRSMLPPSSVITRRTWEDNIKMNLREV
jgi:hypothetical protein